jgi:hypothetical protein
MYEAENNDAYNEKILQLKNTLIAANKRLAQ